jgi:phenylpropionate dioxygenase-like ring-hydroxylating dioxygenase large terminal subunit/AcrR family transcriptional regulator
LASADRSRALNAPTEGSEPRDARRRRELIEATMASIARYGLSGTTVAKVAEIANLSAGIVSFYFRTKEALLLATLEHLDAEFENRRFEVLDRAGADPVRQLAAVIDVYLDPVLSEPERISVWVAFWGEAQARESYQRVCGAREASEEQHVVALFEEIIDRGGYTHLDPIALGTAFHHMLSSLPESGLDADHAFDYVKAKRICRSFLASVFPVEFSVDDVAESSSAPAVEPRTEGAAVCETLPGWIYRNEEFYALERGHIFMRNWWMVGHANQVPNAGDYMTFNAFDERAVVIRGKDDVLRAFYNVCRHRASRVVRGESGNCPGAMVCPYHGWSYGFDGELRAVPAEKTFSNLDKSQMGLIELDLEEWMGIVFIRFGGEGPTVASEMSEFAQEAKLYRIDEMKPWGKPVSLIEDFNWKLFIENDSEGYHVPLGHPGLRRLFGEGLTDTDTGASSSRSHARLVDRESSNWTERSYQRLLPEVSHLPADYQRSWVYYGMFPAVTIQVTPELVDIYQVLPLGPGSCRIQGLSFGHEDDRREMQAARYLNSRITKQVTREDLDFCYWTDQGVRSGGYPGGVYAESETATREFAEHMRALLPVARQAEEPAAGTVAKVNDGLKKRH